MPESDDDSDDDGLFGRRNTTLEVSWSDDDVGELSEQPKAFLSRGRGDGENKGENVFSSQKA